METEKKQEGLNDSAVLESRLKNGPNTLEMGEERIFWNVLKEVIMEPMFILLLAACIIYFAVGQLKEGIIMLASIFIVAGISLFQEYRSKNAVLALKKISAAHSTVIRNGEQINIPSDEIVVDDIVLLEEGELISADALIMSANEFSVNESILTG